MTTPSDLASLARCAHRVFLDAHGNPAEKLPVTTAQQLLWDEGNEHEEEIVSQATCETISPELSREERARQTAALMARGAFLIYHGFLANDDLVGEPDFLQRVDGDIRSVGFSYVPVEIKNGRAFDGKKAKLPYALQLWAYAELLEFAQGTRPTTGVIVDHKGVWNTIELEPFESAYRDARRRLLAVRDGVERTEPGWKPVCANCVWRDHCWKQLVAADDLTTMAGIGEAKRAGLVSIGIRTVTDLAAATPETLRSVRGVGAAAARTWPLRARAVKSNTPILLRPWKRPDVDYEVSYDVENTQEPFVYLHGLSIRSRREDGALKGFDPICAEFPESENEVWKRFLRRVEEIDALQSYAVYIYSPHERGVLRRLRETHGGSAALGRFEERIIDLRRDLARCVIFPTDADGLKTIAHYIDFDWRDGDPGGAQSMAWWKEYWTSSGDNAEARQRVLRYNEDGVHATFAIVDWLERFCAGAVNEGQA